MSLEAAVKFAEKVVTNEALLAQLQNDTEGKDDKAALAAVVAAGKANGLDFTAEEAVQARQGLIIHLKQQSGEELTTEELAQVSGGAWYNTVYNFANKNFGANQWKAVGNTFANFGDGNRWKEGTTKFFKGW
jgi:predicted ribosomally synthesized peptide with nif11-like leader